MSVWRTIPGFPGYLISDEGEVVSPMKTVLRPFGDNKDTFCLKNRDGMQRKRRVADLLKMSRRGRVVEAPMVRTPPKGFEPIPDKAPFFIDRRGRVWNGKTGKEYAWTYVRAGSKSPRVRLMDATHPVAALLELTFGEDAAVAAGLPSPRRVDVSDLEKYGTLQPSRRCHDCGRPTDDYRCPACRGIWRRKHSVATVENGGDFDTLYG